LGKAAIVHIDIIETSPSLAKLEDNWNAVYDADDEAQIFLSWKWLSGWLSAIPGPWFILAAKERDAADQPYVAFFPLRLQTTIEKSDVFSNMRMAGNFGADYTGIICKPEAEHKVIPAFARAIRQMNWARLHLDNVRISERRWRLLTACFPKASFHSTKVDKIIKTDGIDNSLCPYATLPNDWDAYLDALSTNTRQKIRRLLKQIEASSASRSGIHHPAAIDLDPLFALPYAGVADAYLNLGGWGRLPFREAYPRAKAAAMRALDIDEKLAEAHVSLAMVLKEFDWDWVAAGRSYERGLQLNPSYAIGHQWYGEYLAALGRHEEAIVTLKRAMELDPLSLIINATLGRHGYYFARQFDLAIDQLQKTLEMDENFWVARFWLGWTYAGCGRLAEALTELKRARQLDNNLEIIAALGFTHGRLSQRSEAYKLLDELQHISQTRYVSPMIPALIAIGLNNLDEAIDLLQKAYEDRSQMLSELKVEAVFDPLRNDPRFAEILRRVGLAA
jgi:tetratricopeptide (TPR) repeat protein